MTRRYRESTKKKYPLNILQRHRWSCNNFNLYNRYLILNIGSSLSLADNEMTLSASNCTNLTFVNHLRIARPQTSQRSAFVSPPSAPVTTETIRFAIARNVTIIDTTKVEARTTCITQHCRTYRRWIHRRRPTWSRRLSGEMLSFPNSRPLSAEISCIA